MKIILGLVLTEQKIFSALALNMLTTLGKKNRAEIELIRVITNSPDDLKGLKNVIESAFGLPVVINQATPEFDWFKTDYLQNSKTAESAVFQFWKYQLIDLTETDTVLIYIDPDCIAHSARLDLRYLADLCHSSTKKMLAVPAQRPVLERYSEFDLSNPYDYFNCGFFVYARSTEDKNQYAKLANQTLRSLVKKNTAKWGDQDCFNVLFKDKYTRISPRYNLHSGYLHKSVVGYSSLTLEYIDSLRNDWAILHFSGGYWTGEEHHPMQDHLLQAYKKTLSLLQDNKNISTQSTAYQIELNKLISRVAKSHNRLLGCVITRFSPRWALRKGNILQNVIIRAWTRLVYNIR